MPDPVPPTVPSKWPLWVAVVVILALCASLGWLFPSYRKVTKDYADTKTALMDAQTQLVEWKKKSYDRTEYFANGKPKLVIHYGSSSGLNASSKVTEITSDTVKEHDETVTKRGTFVVIGGVDLDLQPAGSVSYQILGPLTLGAGFAGGQPFVGGGLSF